MRIVVPAAIGLSLLVAACASVRIPDTEGPAPPPAKPVTQGFYTGDWREIARNPMHLTDGCVAGLTQFSRTSDGQLYDRDSCRMGSPTGKEKVFAGPAEVIDPPTDAEFRTRYAIAGGLFHVSRTYRVLDHGEEEGGWFIVATPDFRNLSIFTRTPQPTAALKATLVARAHALGYAGTLEFPQQPPA